MDIILQFLREIIMEFPGAFIRSLYFSDKTFRDALEDNSPYNYLLSFLIIFLIVISIVLIKNL